MALTNEAISTVTADQWRSACLHCMTLVDEFWKADCLQEETVEQLLIEVNGDHDDEDEDDQDDDGSDEDSIIIFFAFLFRFTPTTLGCGF